MSVKTTFSNGRTMAAGFYDGLRLTNRQAQIVEMMRNERTKTEIAASLGIQESTVQVTFCNAALANGITSAELRERCNIAPVKVGRKSAGFDAKQNMSEADRLRRELSTIEGRWRKGQINTVEARTQASVIRQELRKRRMDGEIEREVIMDAAIAAKEEKHREEARAKMQAKSDELAKPKPAIDLPGVRKSTMTADQVTLQLALRFNGEIAQAAAWLGWKVKDCLGLIVEVCTKGNVQPTLENFLAIK